MTFLEIAVAILPKTKTEAATDTIALAAVATPSLLEGELGIAVKVLAIIWLAVQIVVKLHTTYWRVKK